MKKHILLIDDDKDELNLFMEALREVPGSYKCTYASSGTHALEMLNYLHPDFIFLDLNMPELNGIDVLSRIKRDKKLYDIPVYLYSSGSNEKMKSVAMSLEAAGYIRKPGSIGELAIILKSVFLALSEPTHVFSGGR